MTDGVEDGRVNGQPAGDAQGTQPREGQKEGGPMKLGWQEQWEPARQLHMHPLW